MIRLALTIRRKSEVQGNTGGVGCQIGDAERGGRLYGRGEKKVRCYATAFIGGDLAADAIGSRHLNPIRSIHIVPDQGSTC